MLQGPLSPLYARIADLLEPAGTEVIRVNLCGADAAAWSRRPAIAFRGHPDAWPGFLRDTIAPLKPDAMLLHGDRRPLHKAAVAWAGRNGVDVLVTELGYLRPDWMTLERGGTSALSHFPSDPAQITAIARRAPDVDFSPRYDTGLWPLIAGELQFAAANTLLWPFWPHYRSHKQPPLHRLYPGWVAARLRGALRRQPDPLPPGNPFVFGLQLEGDFQLREHSPFADLDAAVDHVVGSFARHAPRGSALIVKPHPHDFAWRKTRRIVESARRRHDLGKRLSLIEGHSIGALCQSASGFVSINSSGGFEALQAGVPVHAVMPTIYAVQGLTHQDTLDSFWTGASPPDTGLLADLCRAIAATIQVRGTIYGPRGLHAAADGMAQRILDGSINGLGAYVATPPRLAGARAMGVGYER
ncbi:MAG: capsular biosynthesis protein [Gammaproteobacteria bacterium]|nr:capsular biosynthesis protein [Gammaproteobacteria bacterium]